MSAESQVELQGIGMTSQRTRDRLVARLRREGIRDERVLAAIRTTPRHLFVEEALAHRAYEDTALPIGHGQTISQPFIVALMTQALLEGGPRRRVLEVGTGCGYQTAILASLVERVYSVERIAALLDRARATLRTIGVRNARLHHGDGYDGWDVQGPFDAILVSAAPPEVPAALMAQLAPNGRLVVPVGVGNAQDLLVIDRREDEWVRQVIERVRFVPLLGGLAHE